MNQATNANPFAGYFVDEDGYTRTTENPGDGLYVIRNWTGTRDPEAESRLPPPKTGDSICVCDHEDFVVYECTYYQTRDEITAACGQHVPLRSEKHLKPRWSERVSVKTPEGYRKVLDGDIRAGDQVFDADAGEWGVATAPMIGDDVTAYYGIARR